MVAQVGPNRPVMYAAVAFELGSSGLGSGAFGVLLLRLTQKRFSATQFALLSSLFSIPRVLAGPPAGLLADALGWRDFFVFTVFTGVPGLVMLERFVPWSVREPEFHVAAPPRGAPLSPRRACPGDRPSAAIVACMVGLLTTATLGAIRSYRAQGVSVSLRRCGRVLPPRTLAGVDDAGRHPVDGPRGRAHDRGHARGRRGLRPPPPASGNPRRPGSVESVRAAPRVPSESG